MTSEELKTRLAGRRVIASISGGKDSAAVSLFLREQGVEHERVFMDTGWEHPITYRYLRDELTRVLGPITEIRAPLQMEELARKKGIFPRRTVRWCTQELKVRPMQHYLAKIDDEVVNAVGIRAAESLARSKMTEWEWSDWLDAEVWRPILRWTEEDVIAIHKRYGLRPNPLYLQGASRVGCWPCIFARKDEIRFLADTDAERVERIRALERELGDKMRARAAAAGEECHNPPTWFQGLGRDSTHGGMGVPIDQVIAWSRTLRGGHVEDRQVELFAARDEGCVRWGLCESGAPGGAG